MKHTSWKEKKLTHRDIPVTPFITLEQAKSDFLAAGYYKKEVDSIIVGLSELPEYATGTPCSGTNNAWFWEGHEKEGGEYI